MESLSAFNPRFPSEAAMSSRSHSVPVVRLTVSTYTVPTDFPESDGTLEWNKTTLVLVQVSTAGNWGQGYTYANSATATLIHDTLREIVVGSDAMAPPEASPRMWGTSGTWLG
jgi:hypothetical protein